MLKKKLKALFVEEKGQGMAEYGLILALIAVVVIAGLTALGGQINSMLDAIKSKLVVS